MQKSFWKELWCWWRGREEGAHARDGRAMSVNLLRTAYVTWNGIKISISEKFIMKNLNKLFSILTIQIHHCGARLSTLAGPVFWNSCWKNCPYSCTDGVWRRTNYGSRQGISERTGFMDDIIAYYIIYLLTFAWISSEDYLLPIYNTSVGQCSCKMQPLVQMDVVIGRAVY